MEKYSEALPFYEKVLEITENSSCYDKTARIYENMEEYSKALLFYEKTLRIVEKTVPPNHANLAACYSNIGGVYYQMEEYSKALSQFEYALNILKNSLPTNPNIKTVQDNIDFAKKNSPF
jgi:tetratricopeptide (TPR) repeat protein